MDLEAVLYHRRLLLFKVFCIYSFKLLLRSAVLRPHNLSSKLLLDIFQLCQINQVLTFELASPLLPLRLGHWLCYPLMMRMRSLLDLSSLQG